MQALVKGGDRLEMDFHSVGYRPTPGDEFPIISAAPGVGGLYIAVMHSGITLAPAHQGHGYATEALECVLDFVFGSACAIGNES